jgi:hypothetical protein
VDHEKTSDETLSELLTEAAQYTSGEEEERLQKSAKAVCAKLTATLTDTPIVDRDTFQEYLEELLTENNIKTYSLHYRLKPGRGKVLGEITVGREPKNVAVAIIYHEKTVIVCYCLNPTAMSFIA